MVYQSKHFLFQVYPVILTICIGSDPANFDIVIVNDQLEKSYQELKTFLLPIINQIKQ